MTYKREEEQKRKALRPLLEIVSSIIERCKWINGFYMMGNINSIKYDD